MNKDQFQGSMKHILGRMQEDFGTVIGNSDQQLRGLQKQVSGRAEQRMGDVKQLAHEAEMLTILVRGKPVGFK